MQRAAPQEFDRVLSSMCTRPHPAARKAAERFFATNPGDPATYQAVAALEEDALSYLGDITGLPAPHGYVTSGGTEANIQAIRAARNHARDDDPNVVAPESIHFSFQKAADVLDVELRVVPVDDDYRANVAAVREAVDDHTVLVAGVAGTTEFGRVDPIPELTAVAHDAGALMHVDAAWGGFVLPFTDHEWSFAHAPVDSMTIDPHKYGQAVVPAGGLLFRDKSVVDSLAVDTPYLESASQASLTGTRSGAGVASAATTPSNPNSRWSPRASPTNSSTRSATSAGASRGPRAANSASSACRTSPASRSGRSSRTSTTSGRDRRVTDRSEPENLQPTGFDSLVCPSPRSHRSQT